jgi:predicted HicB family RNase H-like nuclease
VSDTVIIADRRCVGGTRHAERFRSPRQPHVQLKLRMPRQLRARLEAAAIRNGRSLNAEAVARLERYLDGGE